MAKILIKTNTCKIEDESDIEFLWALNKELSYKVQGAYFTRAYRGYVNKQGKFERWDGTKKLLTNDLRFPIGLLQRVESFYLSANKAYEIVDLRNPKTESSSISIIKNLEEIGKTPFPYQLGVIDTVTGTNGKDRGIIRAATGSGKTLIMSLLTAKLGKTTNIYVIGKDLLYQVFSLFSKAFKDTKIGIIGDGVCEIGDINVVSVWTAGQALGFNAEDRDDEKKIEPEKYANIRDIIKNAKVNIFDECHSCSCDTIQNICSFMKSTEYVYGFSASPWRDDGSDLLIESVLGHRLVDIPASTLIKQGYLVKPIIKFYNVPPQNMNGKQYKTIYKEYIVNNPDRNSLVCEKTNRLVELGYKTLVLYESINHGKILNEIISKEVPCILLSGKDDTKTRMDAKEKIENGEIKCILASKIFDLGVDIPALSGLVCASGGKSSIRALQRIGRVIRNAPNKKNAAVADFVDQAKYLKKHSKERHKIYSTEEEFDVSWPKKK